MNWFVRNALALNIFLLVMALSWIHGGTRPDLLLPVIPWLTFIMLQVLIVFPQAKSTENLIEARQRVWRSLLHDPLTWIALLLLIYLVIPLFNVAGEPVFDEAAQRWINPDAFVTWLPSCVKADEHAVVLLWFAPALLAALAARHGLLKRGKRLLLEMICWNGTLLAAIGFAQLISGTDRLLWLLPLDSHFFATFGYPNFAGAFFTLVFALSCGLWGFETTLFLQSQEVALAQAQKSVFVRQRMLLPMVLNFLAAQATLSRATILLSSLVLVVFAIYMLAYTWQRITQSSRVKIFASIFLVIALMLIALLLFRFEGFFNELRTISPQSVIERVSGTGYYHTRVAREIYQNNAVFGVGGWGYPYYQLQYMAPEDIKRMQIQGGVNVHNDALQFLAEHGYIGFALMVLCALMLVWPLWLAVVWLVGNSVKISHKDVDCNSPAGHWFYCIPIPLAAVFIGTTATVCHAMGDLPFRNPAVLTVWMLAFVCVPGWIPVIKRQHKSSID
jgi:hypothetical protein